MQKYLVGGAVRDNLLGIPNQDRDWVVVGSSFAEMQALGYKPVGMDFPVFLHPDTHEEYALARTERKIAHGYGGFTFYADKDVSLEEDLKRRDLTINAMAQDSNGAIIDPFGGQEDLKRGILRHVSEAFVEDPLRVLRTARFAARYGFTVADETLTLMSNITKSGELLYLAKERIWQELAKGLMEKQPSIMFNTLKAVGALKVLLPEVDALFGVPQRADYHPEVDSGIHAMMVVDQTAKMNLPLEARYAALCHDLGKALTPKDILPKHHGHEEEGIPVVKQLNSRLQVPKACAGLADIVVAQHGHLHALDELKPQTILKVLQACDAFRRKDRFLLALDVCVADCRGRLGFENSEYSQKAGWEAYLSACLALDTKTISASVAPKAIAETIRLARLNAIKQLKKQIT